MSETQKTIIDLTQPETSSVYDGDATIQKDALRDILTLLPKGLDSARSESPQAGDGLKIRQNRPHDAIMINGGRGYGKTSLMVTLLNAIEHNKLDELSRAVGHNSPKTTRYFSLGLIDPTLIDAKQNFMLLIINRIHTAVKISEPLGSGTEQDRQYQKALNDLACGVQVLDGIAANHLKSEAWEDPLYVLDSGLNKVEAHADFERRFVYFVDAALSKLKKDAFVLGIDDVDTRFEQGWPVLEAIRKYLTAPNLKILISGDINLYSLLVRRAQWDQFGKAFLKTERLIAKPSTKSKLDSIVEMVEQLQNQYLIKILKPENRVSLKTLKQNINNYDQKQIYFKIINEKIELPINQIFLNFAQNVCGITKNSHKIMIRDQLLNQPIRTIIQTLRGCSNLLSTQYDNISYYDRDIAIESLVNIGFDYADHLRLNIKILKDGNPDQMIATLAYWLMQMDHLPSLERLTANHEEKNQINLITIMLNAIIYEKNIKNTKNIFNYLIKVCILSSLIKNHPNTLDNLFKHTKIDDVEPLTDTIGRIISWQVGSNFSKNMLKTASIYKIPLELVNIDILDYINTKANDQKASLNSDFIFILKILIVRISNQENHIYDYICLPRLIAFIGELSSLRITQNQKYDSTYKEERIRKIRNITEMSAFGKIHTIASFHQNQSSDLISNQTTTNTETDNLEYSQESKLNINAKNEFFTSIETWLSYWDNKKIHIPADTILSILEKYTDFSKKILQYKKGKRVKKINAEDLLFKHVIIFLSSVAIETYLNDDKDLESLNQDLLIDSNNLHEFLSKKFLKKEKPDYLNSYTDNKTSESENFFMFIFTCPIWDNLIKTNTNLLKLHKSLQEEIGNKPSQIKNKIDAYTFEDIHQFLNQLSILDQNK